MEAMELKSMIWTSLENSSMEEGVKYARISFWKKLIFGSFDLRGVFWELQKIDAFLVKAIIGKIVADFKSFKKS